MKFQRARRFQMTVVGLLLIAMIAISGATLWMSRLMHSAQPGPRLSAIQSEQQTRLIEVTLVDVWATWDRLFRANHLKVSPADTRFFVGTKTSPCGQGEMVNAPFYCSKDKTLNFDLNFFNAVAPQLREIEDQAGKLIIAHIAAEAVRDQLGPLAREATDDSARQPDQNVTAAERARQVDCLTGVWAADARRRLGNVPEGRYGRALQGARRIMDRQQTGGWTSAVILNSFRLGSLEQRDLSFLKGYDSGRLDTCLFPDPVSN